MRQLTSSFWTLLIAGLLCASCSSTRHYAEAPRLLGKDQGLIILDGELTAAKWDDGDTFSVRPATRGRKIRARLKGTTPWSPTASLRILQPPQPASESRSVIK